MVSKECCRNEIRAAIRQLSDRCLYSAAKWAGEQLVGIEQDPSNFTPANTRFQRGSSSIRRRFSTNESISTPLPSVGFSQAATPLPEEDEAIDGDIYLLAKSYFDCREYRRASHMLRDQVSKKSLFLRYYALYLAGEKRKEEEMIELEGPLGKSDAINRELVSLERDLSALRRTGAIDSFGLYLYGVVLKEKGNESLARASLVESVNSYPWNWSAWSELQSLCTSIEILNSLNLNNHWMKEFFLGNAYQELRMHTESLAKYEYLQGIFSFSNYIQAQTAKAQYSLREFDQVEIMFEELLRNDPYRVEDMDLYSNVLYAKEACAALSYLAHKVFLTDKYRPESCCIIGNYYSLKGQHEKAVMYFRRALKLNKKYLSAWTLMGHEYVEMKNTPAAIDAYRRAVDINPTDYRAWYGLGQAYEMMGMPFYALHYFRKSIFFLPNDSRLWIAMAKCYQTEQLYMLEEAIKCYKRAVNCTDTEGIALNQLAKLHQKLGRNEEAAYYFEKDLERMDAEGLEGPNMFEALVFLATHFKNHKKFEEAEVYCTRLLDYSGPEKEKAKSLLRGIRMAQTGFPSMDLEHFPI
ncbi:cell division cycle protein 23 homolog [Arabidopsis thaliana]|jgi:anaphase-promoting complex subunit 8|uniref:Anaphase-promoting complex subunit 8 n=4 Tax=Arabidopsis TaxID=3701 RepID=CDC23_ARATH|nr:anaphase-promoting complex subunit 8 [Arabidopsis thaliana]Q9STS3.1 RecName: Full=Anaphase-promoting complex subunit 8; AltName: Full=Cell division cycle protein 23 homolog; Short=CDC23 homolog; AltName: Full=Cyclosome subunit 8 [Arabidopsis thaliana]KAG7633660.1 Tetratricopeptide repeat [Arabidopsis suecica]AAL09801.1 AT3g48150/T24C20_30 [Arabidopsis thaliana]AAM20630.1 cell division cycle protein 23-like protein [Arabidopsis thaliana]AAN15608.1 cell division cycle protein 23-like protein |eukprot:NP_190398.1 anaphase-promoting complex subunit 8 [Arabidopsis thaliana]